MDYIIRQATAKDIPSIINLNKAVMPDFTYNAEYYEILIEDFYDLVFVAEYNKQIIGYILNKLDYTILFKQNKFSRKGYMVGLAVYQNVRKNGIASRLIEQSVMAMINTKAQEYYLHVSTKNKQAISLYGRCGFVKIGSEKNFYRRIFQDAHVLLMDLSGTRTQALEMPAY